MAPPGVLEIHPGGADHLLLRAHLPYWEGLIHVAERAGRMVGADVGPAVRTPGAWGPFEAAGQGSRAIRAARSRPHPRADAPVPVR